MSHAYEPASRRRRRDRSEEEPPSKWTAFAVHLVADIAAGFVGLWIVIHLLGASRTNLFVQYVRDMAYWLAGWTQNILAMGNEYATLALNYGLPAIVYLLIGHGAAARIRRV